MQQAQVIFFILSNITSLLLFATLVNKEYSFKRKQQDHQDPFNPSCVFHKSLPAVTLYDGKENVYMLQDNGSVIRA